MDNDQTTEQGTLDDLCAAKSRYVDKTLKWYQGHATWPRLAFRSAGVIVIVLSLSIPFLAAASGQALSVGVPVASLLIAVLTALNGFFAWQKTWEKRISAQLTLEGLVALWETEISAARRLENSQEGYERALRATQELIDRTRSMTVAETGAFFSSIKFPDLPAGEKGETATGP